MFLNILYTTAGVLLSFFIVFISFMIFIYLIDKVIKRFKKYLNDNTKPASVDMVCDDMREEIQIMQVEAAKLKKKRGLKP